MPLYVLGYTRTTMAVTEGSRNSDMKQKPKKQSQFGLKAEIRLHEAGIASNGRSAYCREYVRLGLVHTAPSHHESCRDTPKACEPTGNPGN